MKQRRRIGISLVYLFALILSLSPANIVAQTTLALLNQNDLGPVIIPAGSSTDTASFYAPLVYQAGQVAVNNSATFSRTLYHVETISLGSGSEYLVGRPEQLGISVGPEGSAVWNWITSHSADVPNIIDSLNAANLPDYSDGVHPGDVFCVGTTCRAVAVGSPSTPYLYIWWGPTCEAVQSVYYKWPFWGMKSYQNPAIAFPTQFASGLYTPVANGCQYYQFGISWSQPITGTSKIWPTVFSSTVFAELISQKDPLVIAAEVDNVIAVNQNSVSFPPWTQDDINEAWRLAHQQLNDSRYSNLPPDNRMGNTDCSDRQGT